MEYKSNVRHNKKIFLVDNVLKDSFSARKKNCCEQIIKAEKRILHGKNSIHVGQSKQKEEVIGIEYR